MNVGCPLKGKEIVESAAVVRSLNTDDALQYVTRIMFDHLCSLVSSCNFYLEGKEVFEALKYAIYRD